jgi:hypothetical protein
LLATQSRGIASLYERCEIPLGNWLWHANIGESDQGQMQAALLYVGR